MQKQLSRRRFLKTTGAAGAMSAVGLATAVEPGPSASRVGHGASVLEQRPALLGGPALRSAPFPSWPVIDERDDRALLGVLHSGKWFRGYGQMVDRFEQKFAELMGARHCIATANGTSALLASLGALEIGPGDEVILPPYTFVATLNVILVHYALPVFVDVDRETFQMDHRKLEAAVTERTAAIIPVHLGGSVVQLDAVLEIARRHRLPVIEDACQSHLAEWRGKRVGTYGATGCFSFQASKNLNCGEGGAILTDDPDLAQRCYAFHNNARMRGSGRFVGARASNLRLTEFQAGLLLSQMTRLEEQSRRRDANAKYLTRLLGSIAGIEVARMYEGCTRNAWHLYMFRYQAEAFAGLPRSKFIRALRAEGVPCSGGYSPMHRASYVKETLRSKAYKKIYPARLLAEWEERNMCPENDRLCQEAVWLTQTMLLGTRRDMEDIAAAIRKIQRHAGPLAKA